MIQVKYYENYQYYVGCYTSLRFPDPVISALWLFFKS